MLALVYGVENVDIGGEGLDESGLSDMMKTDSLRWVGNSSETGGGRDDGSHLSFTDGVSHDLFR